MKKLWNFDSEKNAYENGLYVLDWIYKHHIVFFSGELCIHIICKHVIVWIQYYFLIAHRWMPQNTCGNTFALVFTVPCDEKVNIKFLNINLNTEQYFTPSFVA